MPVVGSIADPVIDRNRLLGQLLEVYHLIRQLEEVHMMKLDLRSLVYDLLKTTFAVDLYVVGSSVNGLATRDSDADMCLVFRDRPETLDQMGDAFPLLKQVMAVMSGVDRFRNIELINAKVPILKFSDSKTGIKFDLNVNNLVGIRNTRLTKCYVDQDDRVAPLVLVVKHWASKNAINSAHNKTISNYSLLLMVIHYLQYRVHPPVLRCLQNEFPGRFLPDSDVKHLSLFETWPKFPKENHQDLGSLFLGFLRYYGYEFNYDLNGLSVRLGTIVSKQCLQAYRSSKNCPGLWKFLCIEEPFDRTNTAGSVYAADTFHHIITVFQASYEKLRKTYDFYTIL